MFVIIATLLGNFIVGGLIGICGVAGFLLPMMYTGLLGLPVSQALTLSFLAFFVSGAIGSVNYHKQGNLDVRFSLILGVGSFLGGLLGVRLNALVTPFQAKVLLYLVVLLSGFSILLREKKAVAASCGKRSKWLDSPVFIIGFGFVTGAICSLSGAGGPVLVMPLLVALGMPVHMAIGVALFDSVFIALPACIGYMMQCDLTQIAVLMVITILAHGAGTLLGSSNAHKIRQTPLKMGVAIFSICLSVYMIGSLLF